MIYSWNSRAAPTAGHAHRCWRQAVDSVLSFGSSAWHGRRVRVALSLLLGKAVSIRGVGVDAVEAQLAPDAAISDRSGQYWAMMLVTSESARSLIPAFGSITESTRRIRSIYVAIAAQDDYRYADARSGERLFLAKQAGAGKVRAFD